MRNYPNAEKDFDLTQIPHEVITDIIHVAVSSEKVSKALDALISDHSLPIDEINFVYHVFVLLNSVLDRLHTDHRIPELIRKRIRKDTGKRERDPAAVKLESDLLTRIREEIGFISEEGLRIRRNVHTD